MRYRVVNALKMTVGTGVVDSVFPYIFDAKNPKSEVIIEEVGRRVGYEID